MMPGLPDFPTVVAQALQQRGNSMTQDAFEEKGWVKFPVDPHLSDWVRSVAPQAAGIARNPAHTADWLRCGGTWFAGVDVLGNAPDGSVGNGPPLAGQAAGFCRRLIGAGSMDWGNGQLSVCYPGYPQRDAGESDAAVRYRLNRDTAHLDGLKATGPERRRKMLEYHGFILGIPLNEVPEGASPFVIWEGSHNIIRAMLQKAFAGRDPADWPDVDMTEAYQETRRRIWDECARVELTARPGEAYVAHRFALHGVAPWRATGPAPEAGRMIVYFRPEMAQRESWLNG